MKNQVITNQQKNTDFFICDLGEVIPKSDIASMEHPLFTLSTRADKKVRYYEYNGNSVTITPSVLGQATIFDKDILIYCISQLMAGINNEATPSKHIRLTAHELLTTINRPTSGNTYRQLKDGFKRLAGIVIETDIKTNNQSFIKGFHLIEDYEIIYDDPKTKNRMIGIELTLSDWLYNSVLGKEVLTINRDYFKLRKPLERRVYELARKHCGNKKQWQIGFDNLYKKVGSSGTLKNFKIAINVLIDEQNLPDYQINLEGKNVIFSYVEKLSKPDFKLGSNESNILLKSQTIITAKKLLNNEYDVYAIEAEWKCWWKESGCPELKSQDGAFIGFCKKKMEQLPEQASFNL